MPGLALRRRLSSLGLTQLFPCRTWGRWPLSGQQLLHKGQSQAQPHQQQKQEMAKGQLGQWSAVGHLEYKVARQLGLGWKWRTFQSGKKLLWPHCWIRLGLGFMLCYSSGALLRARELHSAKKPMSSNIIFFQPSWTGTQAQIQHLLSPASQSLNHTAVSKLASLTPMVLLLTLPGTSYFLLNDLYVWSYNSN